MSELLDLYISYNYNSLRFIIVKNIYIISNNFIISGKKAYPKDILNILILHIYNSIQQLLIVVAKIS